MPRLALHLPGQPCTLDFEGFGRPLGVTAGALHLRLAPWTYRRHLDTLRTCLHAADGELALDSARLADAVLNAPQLGAPERRRLDPLALWWAAGGDAPLPDAPATDAWLPLGDGPVRARLRPWRERQRIAALDAALGDGGDGPAWFDPVAYLDGMVRACLQQLDGPVALDDLDSRATAVLLHATVALNLDAGEDDRLLAGGPAARECAARTLRLCRALGWTPARVWATPAAEVDRLLRLLDLVQPAAPARPPDGRGLADHPDATVIRFDDDPPRVAP